MRAFIRRVLLVVLVASSWPCASSPAFAATLPACAQCRSAAARRFLGSKRALRCEAAIPAADEARLERAIRKCEARWACGGPGGAATVLAAVRQAVQILQASICADPCLDGSCVGDVIDPTTIRGPVGQSPPAVAPGDAPSLADVDRFCREHPDTEVPPPLLALPAAGTLPDWCGEDAAYAALVAVCGDPRVLFVAKGGSDAGADGSVGRPFASVTTALAACRGACHVVVGPGLYAESPAISACTFVEGGVVIENGIAVRGATRPRIVGHVRATGDAIVLARLDVQDSYGAFSSDGDVLVSEAILRGGYQGGSSAWSATGPRICRSQLAAGYGGFDIAWHSSRLWLAGSAVSACYEGVALSWGSRDLKVLDSIVYGGNAIGTSWGSSGVEVRGNRLAGAWAAVTIHVAPDENGVLPATFDVSVVGNSIAAGTLPPSDPSLKVVVENNTFD